MKCLPPSHLLENILGTKWIISAVTFGSVDVFLPTHRNADLDEMKASGLNYKGWQRDINEAERYCIDQSFLVQDMIEKMQYKFMFNTCRMPSQGSDVVRTYDPAKHGHIVVVWGFTICRRCFVMACLNTRVFVLLFVMEGVDSRNFVLVLCDDMFSNRDSGGLRFADVEPLSAIF